MRPLHRFNQSQQFIYNSKLELAVDYADFNRDGQKWAQFYERLREEKFLSENQLIWTQLTPLQHTLPFALQEDDIRRIYIMRANSLKKK